MIHGKKSGATGVIHRVPPQVPLARLVTIMAPANSAAINGDAEHLRILRKAWDAKFERLCKPRLHVGVGETYGLMYGSPEAMNLLVNGVKNNRSSR